MQLAPNQPIQPAIQPAIEPAIEPVSESVDEPVPESTYESVYEPAPEPAKQKKQLQLPASKQLLLITAESAILIQSCSSYSHGNFNSRPWNQGHYYHGSYQCQQPYNSTHGNQFQQLYNI